MLYEILVHYRLLQDTGYSQFPLLCYNSLLQEHVASLSLSLSLSNLAELGLSCGT